MRSSHALGLDSSATFASTQKEIIMITYPFMHHVAQCFLAGKTVVVYGDGQIRQLRAEHVDSGQQVARTREVTITRAQYEALRDEWTEDGALAADDVRITERALEFLSFAPGATGGWTCCQLADIYREQAPRPQPAPNAVMQVLRMAG